MQDITKENTSILRKGWDSPFFGNITSDICTIIKKITGKSVDLKLFYSNYDEDQKNFTIKPMLHILPPANKTDNLQIIGYRWTFKQHYDQLIHVIEVD